uniref:Endonuclease/exonuclease/phosphatase domain-containing protein n=1 Tax=Cacopsylla melanoneura TaxID=428564 RepID=A0A8D8YRD8_9HEMI
MSGTSLLLLLGLMIAMSEPCCSSDHQLNNDEIIHGINNDENIMHGINNNEILHGINNDEILHGINTIQHIYEETHKGRHKRSARSSSNGTPSKDYPGKNNSLFAPLSIINWNIEGIKYQLTHPEKLFQDADLVMLTETLNTERPASLPGYSCVASPARQLAKYGRPVGGLTVYAKPYLNLRPVHINDNRLHLDTVFGSVLCYYFHPSRTVGDIIGEICRDLKNHRDDVVLIGGDFNTRIETNDTKSDTLLSFMKTIGFELVNNPRVATFRSRGTSDSAGNSARGANAVESGNSVIDLVFIKEGKYDGKNRVDVLRTENRKHQRVYVRTKLKVKDPTLYELHRTIEKMNEEKGEEAEVKFNVKSKGKEKEKLGWVNKWKDKWRSWFG